MLGRRAGLDVELDLLDALVEHVRHAADGDRRIDEVGAGQERQVRDDEVHVAVAAQEPGLHVVEDGVRAGHVRAAIIDFGGFLGVGSRKIAVDWNALRFHPDSAKRDVITLELTRDQVKAAPEYKDKQPVVVLGASGGLQSLPTDW